MPAIKALLVAVTLGAGLILIFSALVPFVVPILAIIGVIAIVRKLFRIETNELLSHFNDDSGQPPKDP